jgi:acyl-coenzyme A thioesterase PaaI-like protein
VRSIYEIAESANSDSPWGFFDHSPMLGRANPLAPPIVLRPVDERTLEGTASFGAAYEGPPGCVHGGYVAAAFDEVLGSAQALSGQPGMTAKLTIDYRSPTPLHAELRFVGRFDRIDGRKVFASGTVHAEETLCAEAEGLFVSIGSERFQGLQAARDDRRRGGAVEG